MISQNNVLTATSLVMNNNLGNYDLSDHYGNFILGLNTAVSSLDGYTLDNLATKLPENTKGESEHSLYLNEGADRLAKTIRLSLGVIKDYISPICRQLDEEIKHFSSLEQIQERIYNNLNITYININPEIFNSAFYPQTPNERYSSNVTATVSNFDLGKFDSKTGEEVSQFISPSIPVPELDEYLNDYDLCSSVWRDLSWNSPDSIAWELFGTGGKDGILKPNEIKLSMVKSRRLIVASLILSKLKVNEDPIDGLTGITLETYRQNVSILKDVIDHILFRIRNHYQANLKSGLYIEINNTDFNENGTFCGDVTVGYSEITMDYFSNSDDYSLTDILFGYLLIQKSGKDLGLLNDVITNIDAINKVAQQYFATQTTRIVTEQKTEILGEVKNALKRMTQEGGVLFDYINATRTENETKDNNYWLLNQFDKRGGCLEMFTHVPFIDGIISGEQQVINTKFSVILAEVLNTPIAAQILKASLEGECGCQETQRKNLTKAIIKVILDTLKK